MGKNSPSKKQTSMEVVESDAIPNVGEAGQGFGKLLASPEREVRERALRSLVRFLKAKETSSQGLGELDLLKIWKGVFYCFWYTDKVPVQQEQAQALAMVIHEFKHFDTAVMFYVCFLKTMQREWGGIDQHRVDKFYSLIRRMLRQVLVRLDKSDWPLANVETFSEVIMEIVMNIQSGIRYHICDIFLPELVDIAGARLPMEQFNEILAPFFFALSNYYKSDALFNHVMKTVITPLHDTYAADLTGTVAMSDDAEVAKVFVNLDLNYVSKTLFSLAADSPEVKNKQREALYDMQKIVVRVARTKGHVGGVEQAKKIKLVTAAVAVGGKRARSSSVTSADGDSEEVAAPASVVVETKSSKKKKKKAKKQKTVEVVAEVVEEEEPVMMEEVIADEEEEVEEEKPVAAALESKSEKKKSKKNKKKRAREEAEAEAAAVEAEAAAVLEEAAETVDDVVEKEEEPAIDEEAEEKRAKKERKKLKKEKKKAKKDKEAAAAAVTADVVEEEEEEQVVSAVLSTPTRQREATFSMPDADDWGSDGEDDEDQGDSVNAVDLNVPISVKKNVQFALHKNKIRNLHKITSQMRTTPILKGKPNLTPRPALKTESRYGPPHVPQTWEESKQKLNMSSNKKKKKKKKSKNQTAGHTPGPPRRKAEDYF